MLRKIILPSIFAIGLMIFSYPIVSNWLSTKEHYTVISKHNEALEKMTEEEMKQERKKAKTYNKSVNEASIPIEDPFSEKTDNNKVTGYYDVLDIGESMGSLEIPSINANLPIYHGVGDDVLQRGIGHMSNSSFPIGGLGSHTALTGHRGLPSSKLFRDLDKVKKDDVFYIKTLGETLAYQVDDIKIVLPQEMDWLEMKEDKDYVTLITCEPYMINTHRLLVRGERIPYIPSEEPYKASTIGSNDNQFFTILSFIVGVLLTVLILILLYKRKQIGEE